MPDTPKKSSEGLPSIAYSGRIIDRVFPSGYYRISVRDKEGRHTFVTLDDLGDAKAAVDADIALDANRLEVVVGNIGSVYLGDHIGEAARCYGEYKRQSADGYGRAAGEPVTLFKDGEVHWDYAGAGRED